MTDTVVHLVGVAFAILFAVSLATVIVLHETRMERVEQAANIIIGDFNDTKEMVEWLWEQSPHVTFKRSKPYHFRRQP